MRTAFAALIVCASLAQAAPPVPITALAFSPRGDTLAAGSRDTVTLLDSATGDMRTMLVGQDGRVTALAYAPNGTLAVASGRPGQAGIVRFYESKSTEPVATLPTHKDLIYALAWSPDGTTLATASYDRTVKLWSAASPTPALTHTLTDHSDSVYAVAFHPNGKLLASAAADRSVKIWEVASGRRLFTLSDATDWIYALAWGHDGTTLAATGVDKSLRVWTITTTEGKLAASVIAHAEPVTHLLADPARGRYFTVGQDRVVKVWDAAKLSEITVFPEQPEAVLAATLAPGGEQLALGRFDGTVLILDAKTGAVQRTPLPEKPVISKASPDFLPHSQASTITLHGRELNRLTGVRAASGDATLTLKPFDDSRPDSREITVLAPRAGIVKLVGIFEGGETKPFTVWADWFAPVSKSGSSLKLPATVPGTLAQTGAVDEYSIELQAGEEVGLELITDTPGDKFTPTLTLRTPRGQVLASVTNNRLAFTAPSAGKFLVSVRDKQFRGKARYRLHLGSVPVLEAVTPLAIPRGATTTVQLIGANLGPNRSVEVTVPADAAIGSTISVPVAKELQAAGVKPVVRVASTLAVAIGANQATLDAIPASVEGVLTEPGVPHQITFRGQKGVPVVLEVEAARFGSPVDSTILITDAAGVPVPRAVLRSVARAFTTFRNHDASGAGIRLEAWNELGVDDFLYANGELMRIKSLPKTIDDDCIFYSAEGRRTGFLATTTNAHSNGTALYKVEIHPPGRTFPPNGMPVITVPYRNDDAHGRDSQLTFIPPADGDYVAVVADATDAAGPAHAYRLTVRPPEPRFTLSLSPTPPQVWAGGAIPLTIRATRIDEFDGPIEITFENLPPGFSAPATRLEAGQLTAVVPLSATSDAAAPPDGAPPARVVGRATVEGREVVQAVELRRLSTRTGGDLTVTTNVQEIHLKPGGEARMIVAITRHEGHDGRVPCEFSGLPHGVKVVGIGLNGILITPDRTAREVVLHAEPWVRARAVPFTVEARSERKNTAHAAPPVRLVVE